MQGQFQNTVFTTIGWDLGNVILDFSKDQWFDAMSGNQQLATSLEHQLEVGSISEKDFLSGIQQNCMAQLTTEEIRELFTNIFTRNPPMESFVLDFISSGKNTNLLLSNTNSIHWPQIESLVGHVLNRFDALLLSHQCGFRKPDIRFFQSNPLLINGNFLFIDDLEENLSGALALGGEGFQFTGIESLKHRLESMG